MLVIAAAFLIWEGLRPSAAPGPSEEEPDRPVSE
jgi:hypothetical protein